MVHANLEDGKLRISRHARQGQRHAPVIVVTGHRGMGSPLKLKDPAQHLFRRGLAHRAGHRQHFRRAPRPRGPAQVG